MRLSIRPALARHPSGTASRAAALLLAIALSGCTGGGLQGFGRTTSAAPAADPVAAAAVPASVPADYCPELRVRAGTETLKRGAGGAEAAPADIVWQATIGDSARDCRIGADGRLVVRVGIAGRVLAGPKGGPQPVSVPVRIAVVRFPEELIASEARAFQTTIPQSLSAPFRQVFEIAVARPSERNLIVYVGFDEGGARPKRRS